MPLFADASYFIALTDPEDQWHAGARRLVRVAERRAPLETHALVVGEVVAVVGSSAGGKAARQAYEGMRDNAIVHVPALDDLDEAMHDVVRYDGTLSLSDTLSLHLMRRRGIRDILSFDRDFDGKGVRRLTGRT